MVANSLIKVSVLVLGLLLCGSATTQAFNPTTDRILRLGTNFTLTCIDDGNGGNNAPSVRFVVNGHNLGTNTDNDNMLRSRGIIWNFITNGTLAVGNLAILASAENNGTKVQCIAGSFVRPQQRIIAVEGPPGPPVAPSVTVTNLTALTLTWTAPWPFPVINYTVTMLNLTSNQITQWTTCDEQLVLRGGGGQCDELVFTVEAETDVGSTGPSTNTTSGFPKGLDTTARNQSTVTITCRDRNTNILHAAIQVPEVCPYEAAIVVTLVLTDVLNGGTIVYGPTNQLMFDVSSDNVSNITNPLSCNSTYNVSLVVENQASQRITINTVYTSMPSATTTTSQAVTTPTPTNQVESTVSNWITIGIPVILSIIILIIIVTITIMTAVLLRHSSKQHMNASQVELDEKERQENNYEFKT